jgi:hypothetical protein
MEPMIDGVNTTEISMEIVIVMISMENVRTLRRSATTQL